MKSHQVRLAPLFLVLLFAACQPQAVLLPEPTAAPASPVPAVALPSATRSASPTTIPPTATLQPTLTASPLPPSPTPTPSTTTLLFTGVIVPARCVQAALDANGNPDYPYEEVRDIISSAGLAIGTLNASLSDRSPHTGCVRTYMLVGSPNNADAMRRAGFDVMSVATNHIKNCSVVNCGDLAFFDTLDNLRRVGILPVGAGMNQADAAQPLVVTVNGVRFGIVSLGQIEPMAFAGEDSPGIAVLTEASLRQAIADARQVSDVVITMPHWGPEDAATPNGIQQNLAKVAVEAGADLVVGNHTHVVQGLQQIGGVPVFYGLGNFVFDQTLDDHQQGVILLVNFEGRQYKSYELIPTRVDHDGRVHIAGEREAAEILQRIQDASRYLR